MSTVLNPPAPSRHALPDPGEPVPSLSWPIVGIFTGALALFAAGTWAGARGSPARRCRSRMNAIAIFVMFTVLHDASHYSISSHALGQRRVRPRGDAVRLAADRRSRRSGSSTSSTTATPTTTNTIRTTSPATARGGSCRSGSRRWTCRTSPSMCATCRRRPRAEVIESAALLLTFTARRSRPRSRPATFWLLAIVYLIPERIAMIVLAWWFDWLPHHGLEETQSENRYRATRNRVGHGVAVHAADALPELPPRASPAPVDPLLPLRARPGGATRRPTSSATPRSRPRSASRSTRSEFREWKQLNQQAAEGAAGADAERLERPARRLPPACRSPRSTRSPTTARWSPSPCPRSCATSSASSPAST